MAFSTRLTLYQAGQQVFECEPTYWPATGLVDELGLQEVHLSDAYLDWEGTFPADQFLPLEQQFWEKRHFKGYEGSFPHSCEEHETLLRLLAAPGEVDEVRIRVFEWESGLS